MHELETKALARLGGIAGICVGVFVLTFAFLAGSIGTGFVAAVWSGGSIDPFFARVVAEPVLANASVLSAGLGFGAMFVSAFSLYQLIEGPYWQKYLAISGYLVGIPLALVTFVERLALQYQIGLLGAANPDQLSLLEMPARLELLKFHWTTQFIGPFFIVLVGTTCLAWAARREGLIPRWLGYWAYGCGISTAVYLVAGRVPSLEVLGLGGGPVHMLWYLVLGGVLLRSGGRTRWAAPA